MSRPIATGLLLAALAGCGRGGAPEAAPAAAPVPADPAADVATPVRGDREKAGTSVGRARAALARFDRPAARRELDAALAADPACEEALEMLGWLLLEPGSDQDEGAALRRFLELEKLGVATASALGGGGVARVAGGDSAGARPRLEAALAATPPAEPGRLSRFHSALARIEREADRLAESESHGRAAVGLAPNDLARADPLAELGDLLAATGREDEGEKELRAAIVADPELSKGHYLLSRLLARRGKTEEAAKEAKVHSLLRELHEQVLSRVRVDPERRLALRGELVAAAPECAPFRIAWVKALLDGKRHAEAEKALAATIAAGRPTAEVAFLLARARAGQGNLAGADQARTLMRQIDPRVPPDLDRQILAEWKRGVPDVSDDQVESVLLRWSRK
jgi:predicted Zn-dependent protease